ncbi:MAG: universal stress protein [Burkholderiales bacterium]|nr:universal stress protein [Burkholderiales bacterium]
MGQTFERILLASEHGEQDRGAEALAFALSRRCGQPLRLVLPIASNPEFEALAPALAARAEAEAAARLAALRAEADSAGIGLEAVVRRGPELYAEIVAEAAEQRADLIVIRRRGRRGRLANLLVGDMVRSVVAHAPCSVLVVAREARMWQRRVLVAVDPQGGDTGPAAAAAGVAAECGLPLTVICVTEPAAEAMQRAERALQNAWTAARGHGVAIDALMRIGRPHEQIVAAAQELGADLVVIGRHGDDKLGQAWLGGVAQKVIGLADRPVLVSVTPAAARPP